MTTYKHIFTPIKIGKLTVKNRIETAPAMPFLATIDCDVSQELIEWEKAFARGGSGIVTVGDTPIMDSIASKVGHILNLGIDKSVAGLNRLAEAIQRYGAIASIELTFFYPPARYAPDDMTAAQIKELIESYASAAYRCYCAGFDMILIHGAHGHLLSQFLSSRKNHRTDAYGGSFENRARYAMDVLGGIREKVGDKLAIEYRISAEELVPDGLTLEEQLEFARLLQDRIDLLHLSVGRMGDPAATSRMISPTYVPRGLNVHYAARFKQELRIPVTALGSLDLEMAEKIIAENQADIVAMNRTFIADPECVNKARKGREGDIRPCIRCNTCIERTDRFYLSVRCAVNPLCGHEAEFANLPLTAEKKKVVVVGGGPAGMEAARRAAGRGHEVVLLEKEARLGGTLNLAAAPPFKEDMRRYLDWAIRATMNTPRLTVRLSTAATPAAIKNEHPDALIIAAGSVPVVPRVPGIDSAKVVYAGDVVSGRAKTGDSVLIAGAGLTGSETALYLAQQGKKVTLIDMLPLEQVDENTPSINIKTLRMMLEKPDVAIRAETTLTEITPTGAVITGKDGAGSEIPYDTVILALGFTPRGETIEAFRDLAPDVYIIGDCNNRMGSLFKATSEGFMAAMDI